MIGWVSHIGVKFSLAFRRQMARLIFCRESAKWSRILGYGNVSDRRQSLKAGIQAVLGLFLLFESAF